MKGSQVLGVFFIVSITPYLLLSYFKQQGRKIVAKTEFDVYAHDFTGEEGFQCGNCDWPLVFRQAVIYSNSSQDNDKCKTDNANEEGGCATFIKDRMLSFWSDGTIEALPASHVTNNQYYDYYETAKMSLNDYFNNPKYSNYMVHSLTQLGTAPEYESFFQFDRENIESSRNIFRVLRSNPDWVPLGQQFFMSQIKHSGSKLHWAQGVNGFVMLAGRKRWVLVHPAFMDQAGCIVGRDGLTGDCEPNGYLPSHGNISVSEYKDILINTIGIPENAIFDVTLEPGDILINCPLFAHTVENLDETTIAMSFRLVRRKKQWSVYFFEKTIEGIYQAIKTKLFYGNFDKLTLVDLLWQNQGTSKPDIFDKDKRFHQNTYLKATANEKNDRQKFTREKVE